MKSDAVTHLYALLLMGALFVHVKGMEDAQTPEQFFLTELFTQHRRGYVSRDAKLDALPSPIALMSWQISRTLRTIGA